MRNNQSVQSNKEDYYIRTTPLLGKIVLKIVKATDNIPFDQDERQGTVLFMSRSGIIHQNIRTESLGYGHSSLLLIS